MEQSLHAPRGVLFYTKRTIGFLLLLALSATFFYSAYSKSGVALQMNGWRPQLADSSNAFDSFQWTFLDLGIDSVFIAGVIARLMIGMELLVGFFLMFHIFLKEFTYKAVIVILSVFILYLLVVLARQGNTGNCGCFGDKVAMKPLTAIWKNVAMIAATVLLMYIYPVKPYKHQEYVLMVLALAAFSVPFIVNVMYTGTEPVKAERQPDLDLLYQYDPKPRVDLKTGKHIVAFMSLTCPHCKKAAYLLQIIHHEHPDIPIYMVLAGAPEHQQQFFDETHASQVPHMLYRHTEEFMRLTGPGVPAIYWINNGKAEYESKYAYYQLDPKFMEQWLHNQH